MAIYAFGDKVPVIPASCYISPEATIIGSVVLGERVNILPGVVLRGDNDPIVIGDDSNVQDNSVVHTDPGAPVTLGKGVTIGHQVMLHGCTIGDGTLVGIAAVVLNHAVIGKECLVGAGAVVTEGKSFADRSMIVGTPAKVLREVTEDHVTRLRMSAESYIRRGAQYKTDLKRIG
ncbi:gamma carbonic anhydrase family protein [Reyranella sp.]|uniref:gamma carbonic anhydrase family protein n=1 Tax=Reyranella sp. TaxID=1929291 RepID=UPI003BADA78C